MNRPPPRLAFAVVMTLGAVACSGATGSLIPEDEADGGDSGGDAQNSEADSGPDSSATSPSDSGSDALRPDSGADSAADATSASDATPPSDASSPSDATSASDSAPDSSSSSPDAACVPDAPLSTSGWVLSQYLTIQIATTNEYSCTWLVNHHVYDYRTCDGWISDTFITTGGEWAVVGWNLVTNAMYTAPSSGQAYNSMIAMDCARYAKQTIFPGGDLTIVDIR
jgi:hypothetical protein